MAAAIKDKFGLNVELKKGHGGILKIAMGNTVVYDNESQCGQLPTVDNIIKSIDNLK